MPTGQTRSNGKPNRARRDAIRESLPSTCATCSLPVCFSHDTDDKAPHRGTMGHVVGEEIGGTWSAGNIVSQCWACNWAAKARGVADLTADIIPGSAPTKYLPTKAVSSDRRDAAPDADAARYGKHERRAAREARGLRW